MVTTDPLFGIHAQALGIQRQRMELLASNIANADTPGFNARDLDFRAALEDAMKGSANAATVKSDVKYRVPMQPSVDGNTVDVQTEQAQFMDSAMHYQASLSFLDGRLRSLMTAITGE